MAMIKVRTMRVRQSGERGFSVGLPREWAADVDLGATDAIDMYRDEQDRLILVPAERSAAEPV